ncbi:putative TIM-barrel fold metal-dependent hydrolase [Thermocatellispora tengchongensis]|uniref:Putative TIM-barrel fold metal-dependent hydrolase n=1 Tax=Thermocatellispora tengchongensis TaxID=1073253 RepID=A0A840PH22_9ACTN|nr:amidohydrolase family protein [Thermocatellispora tengchongensis]MBB5138432.1 putative TIM-barrel fold metal-dependent hydrolase [Thermocatellispora tengchongensis]
MTAIVDVDSHEMAPLELWGEVFGEEIARRVNEVGFEIHTRARANSLSVPGLTGDTTPITQETVWRLKGATAPSAIDLRRRPDVLDEMGITRQLVFPTFGLFALLLVNDPNAHVWLGFDPSRVDAGELGRMGVAAHNDWAAGITKSTSDRIRPVGIVLTDTSVESMVEQARSAIERGIRALMIPANIAPAGTSPANPELDPFWSLVAEADVPVTIHLGTDFGFLSSSAWSKGVEVFHPSDKSSIELPIEPYRATTIHFCAENMISTMVLGGVFERHPALRFGAIEFAAGWMGPLAERLDCWAESQFRSRLAGTLSMRPSEYIARNVRVTPFYFEPIARYFERHRDLWSVYCYATDYPHVEGGKDSRAVMEAALASLPGSAREQFFARNGELLLPE